MIEKNNVFTGKIVTDDWADQVLENIEGEGYEAIILDEGVDVEIIEPRSEKNDSRKSIKEESKFPKKQLENTYVKSTVLNQLCHMFLP